MPDDAPLENFLRGDDAVTRAYRAGSSQAPPAELDQTILKLAEDEAAKRTPMRRWEWPFAAAAVVVLSVSAVLSLREQPATQPALMREMVPASPPADSVAATPPPVAAMAPSRQEEAKSEVRAAKPQSALSENYMLADSATAEQDDAAITAAPQAVEPARKEALRSRAGSVSEAEAPAASAGFAAQVAREESAEPAPAPLGETQKIDRLIAHVRDMRDVQFIISGETLTAERAADRLERQRSKFGDQIKTAEDFIRLCVPPSDGVRYAGGTERTLAEVLREELKQVMSAPKE
ncbi:MAG: hypothetical protein ACRETN_08995 [Nevskiales bacterium]